MDGTEYHMRRQDEYDRKDNNVFPHTEGRPRMNRWGNNYCSLLQSIDNSLEKSTQLQTKFLVETFAQH